MLPRISIVIRSKYVRVEIFKQTPNYLDENGNIQYSHFSASLPAVGSCAQGGGFANGSDGNLQHPIKLYDTIEETNIQGLNPGVDANGKTSYVYLYTEIEDGLKYGGIKSVDTDKKAIETYKTSSKSKKFQKDIANKKFKLEILFWGSFKECLYVENKLLTENDAADSDLWYNKWNGQKGTPPQNRERRNDIVHDLNILRNVSVIDVKDWKSNPKKYNERL